MTGNATVQTFLTPAQVNQLVDDYRLFTVRGEHGLMVGVHAAVFAALVSRMRVR